MHPEEHNQEVPGHSGQPAYAPAAPARPRPPGRRKWLKGVLAVVAAGLIFTAGFAVGDGSISLNRNEPVSGNLPNRLDYSSVDQVYKSLKENYDGKLDQTQLEDGLKHGLAAAPGDPYTVYFTPKEAREFREQLNNSFSGIGAQLGQDSEKNLEVIAPIDGLPAQKAGLKAKDLITEINGVSTTGMSVDDAVSRIRGPQGTKVTLQVVRDKSETLTFTITREDIKLPSVKTKILDGNIGYLQITSFADDTAELARQAADDFRSKQVNGIILDLRNNPGGLLDASVDVASLWLPEGQVVLKEKRGNTVIKTYNATGGDVLKGTPTTVLVNGGSASASEILAGALRDHDAANIIGEKTYGKGVVQQLINFRDDSQLKVTVASWYLPDGQSINKKGITPGKTVKLSDADAKAGKDTQLEAAQAYLAEIRR